MVAITIACNIVLHFCELPYNKNRRMFCQQSYILLIYISLVIKI